MSAGTPDYFEEIKTPDEACLRRIKGNVRRELIRCAIATDGIESIPPLLLQPGLPRALRIWMMRQYGPQVLGGEDLPDLKRGEVEVARLSYLNTVHREVVSLRARRSKATGMICFNMKDEYGTRYRLVGRRFAASLQAEAVARLFKEADPSPFEPGLTWEITSEFYDGLTELAGIRPGSG